MIFELKKCRDSNLQDIYEVSMKDLRVFFDINITKNKPRVFLLNTREEIDTLLETRTERWLVGWLEYRNVMILNQKSIFNESSHKRHNNKEFMQLIKHELSHYYHRLLSDSKVPIWLWEGVALYLSKQTDRQKRPKEFKTFLCFYDQYTVGDKNVYSESGFVIELLVEKFGKKKLFEFIKTTSTVNSKADLKATFKKIYGIDLTFKSINSIYLNMN